MFFLFKTMNLNRSFKSRSDSWQNSPSRSFKSSSIGNRGISMDGVEKQLYEFWFDFCFVFVYDVVYVEYNHCLIACVCWTNHRLVKLQATTFSDVETARFASLFATNGLTGVFCRCFSSQLQQSLVNLTINCVANVRVFVCSRCVGQRTKRTWSRAALVDGSDARRWSTDVVGADWSRTRCQTTVCLAHCWLRFDCF